MPFLFESTASVGGTSKIVPPPSPCIFVLTSEACLHCKLADGHVNVAELLTKMHLQGLLGIKALEATYEVYGRTLSTMDLLETAAKSKNDFQSLEPSFSPKVLA